MSAKDKHPRAYDRMLERARHYTEQVGDDQRPLFSRAVDYARDKAVELGELTREEAEDIAEYLRRDVHDAATFIGERGLDLGDWLRLDLLLIEDRLLDLFSRAVDQTRLELELLALRAAANTDWRTGEVTGIGTLQCRACGEKIHFHQTGHIPPCPRCAGSDFRRIGD